MTTPVFHHQFTVERRYPASPAHCFRHFLDPEARRIWYIHVEDGWILHDYEPATDPAPGAREYMRVSPPGSQVVITNDTRHCVVVPGELFVYAYWMTLDGAHISASVATVEFRPDGTGTHLVFTEQGTFTEADISGRLGGTEAMMDGFLRYLDRPGVL